MLTCMGTNIREYTCNPCIGLTHFLKGLGGGGGGGGGGWGGVEVLLTPE